MGDKKGIKLVITIVERRQGKKIAELFSKNGVEWHYQSTGMGTASSELLDVLGFGTSERDVLFSMAEENVVRKMMYNLNNDLREYVQAKGIIFSVSLTGMSSLVAAKLFESAEKSGEEGDEKVEGTSNNSLIMVIVNQGHTDKVMETAKKAGARGGTILKARFNGSEESKQFYGITLQAEKEIIMILAGNPNRNLIMESINKEHGVNTEAGAMICSMAVEQVVRLS